MKKDLTEIVFILDRSGSMAGLEADTIGGFNAMIEKQKGEPGQALISTVLFDNEIQVIHDRVPLEKIPPLTEKEYFVRGCTALLDAFSEKSQQNYSIIFCDSALLPCRFLFVRPGNASGRLQRLSIR